MSVRKRVWKNAKGEEKEAWVVDYVDQKGKRCTKTFDRKKDADAHHATVRVEVRHGTHTPDSASKTVAEAGALWITTGEEAPLERATLTEYKRTLDLHIVPFIGRTKLSQLSVPTVRAFEDQLRRAGRSPTRVRTTRTALSMLLTDAQERGLVNRNVVRELKRRKERKAEERQRGNLEAGVDFPTTDEIRRILSHLRDRWRPLIMTAIFCGLRASELRGLRWQDVDFDAKEISVRQRADRYGVIGPPKSKAGNRQVPVPAPVLNALREWKLAAAPSRLDLVFGNRKGNVERLANIINRGLIPVQVEAGVTIDGKAKDTGMHVLRHFFASWCINRRKEGGLELPAKVVQGRLGHSSITMTLDVYGHLFKSADDSEELAAAAAHLFVAT